MPSGRKFFVLHFSFYMQLVIPSVVPIAVRMVITVWMMVFQMSLFSIFVKVKCDFFKVDELEREQVDEVFRTFSVGELTR